MSHFYHSNFHTFTVKSDGGVAWATFLPHVSVHSDDLLEDLNRLCDQLENDTSSKVIVFQSAHAEVFACHGHTMFPAAADQTCRLQTVLQRLASVAQITIAKVEGAAHGGACALALACDMRFATRGKATFAVDYESGLTGVADKSVLCPGGSIARLSRITGLGRAIELAIRKDPVDSDLAEKYGLVNRTLHASEIHQFVQELAKTVSSRSGQEITACKRTVHASVGVSLTNALKEETCWYSGVASGANTSLHSGVTFGNSGLSSTMKQGYGSPKAVVDVPE